MVAFQACIDDSYTAGGTFVLAGHVATADAWVAFSKEWEELLPDFGLHDKRGHYFKMSEMANLAERMERVAAFYRVIERHVLFSISCKFRIDDFHRARRRIVIPQVVPGGENPVIVDWDAWTNPYTLGFRGLLDMFANNRQEIPDILPADQPVDFIFDEQKEKAPLLAGWDAYMTSRDPAVRARYGAKPIFRDDRVFPPIQAADLWAWWVRKWYDEGRAHENMERPDFGIWKAHRKRHPKLAIEFDQDAIAQSLLTVARDHLRPDYWAYDVGLANGIRGVRGNGRAWREAVASFDPRRVRI